MNVKEAVEKAMISAKEMYSEDKIIGLALEEVEFCNESNTWLITLGFFAPIFVPPKDDSLANNLSQYLAGINGETREKLERKNKVFKIDNTTGEVLSMKIWNA